MEHHWGKAGRAKFFGLATPISGPSLYTPLPILKNIFMELYLDITENLTDVPWPIATACSQLMYSHKNRNPSADTMYYDHRNRISVEEESLELLQSFTIHHFSKLKSDHHRIIDILKIVLNSEMPPASLIAAFKLLQPRDFNGILRCRCCKNCIFFHQFYFTPKCFCFFVPNLSIFFAPNLSIFLIFLHEKFWFLHQFFCTIFVSFLRHFFNSNIFAFYTKNF